MIELGEGRKRSAAHELRWLNLCGFCLRPGFGFPGDDFRIEQARRVYATGLQFANQVQNEIEWWIFWGRVAGGLNKNQQTDMFQRLSPVLLPRASKKPVRVNPSLLREMWRAAASLELLPIQTKTQLGDELVARIVEGRFRRYRLVVPGAAGRAEVVLRSDQSGAAGLDGDRDGWTPSSRFRRRKTRWPRWRGEPAMRRAICRQRRWNWCAGRSRISIWKRSPRISWRRWARCSAKSCPPVSCSMNELEIVDRIRKLAKGGARITLGIGDDCAIYRPRASEDLLFTTDQMIEGVHFLAAHKPDAVGERALARSLSDIAAMGGEPRFCLVALATPTDHEQWIRIFLPWIAAIGESHRSGAGRRRFSP